MLKLIERIDAELIETWTLPRDIEPERFYKPLPSREHLPIDEACTLVWYGVHGSGKPRL